jgi:CHAT domain-containing protein/tetratricopeptide (TPR) repeat protein
MPVQIKHDYDIRSPLLLITGICFSMAALLMPIFGTAFQTNDKQEITKDINARLAKKLLLNLGEKNELHLSAGQTGVYAVKLNRNEYLQVDLCSMGADLSVILRNPDDQQKGQWFIARGFTQSICWIANAEGVFQFEFRILKGKITDQTINLQLVCQRKATPQDTRRVSAAQNSSTAIHLRQDWTFASLIKAIAYYHDALRSWQLLKEIPQRAFILCQIGDVYTYLSQYDKALTAYIEAEREVDQPDLKAKILNAMGQVYRHKGDNEIAMRCFSQALDLSRSMRDRWSEARSLYNIGTTYYAESSQQAAQDNLRQALQLSKLIGDLYGQADAHLVMGYSFHAQKDMQKAQFHYEQQMRLAEITEDTAAQALGYLAEGHLMAITGEWQKALNFYDDAKKRFEILGDRTNQNSALQGTAFAYSGMGEFPRALEMFERSALVSHELYDLSMERQNYIFLGEINRRIGDYEHAIQYCKRALRLNKKSFDAYIEASALATLGKIYEQRDNIASSREEYKHALNYCRQAEDRFLEGLLLNAIGRTFHLEGNNQKALEYFSEALSLQKDSGDVTNRPGTLYNIAIAQRDLGNIDTALKNINEAIQSTESLRLKVAGPDFRASYNASIIDIHKYAIELLIELDCKRPYSGFDAEALQASERARARSLLESMAEAHAGINQGVDRHLLENELSLQRKLNAKGQEHMNLLSGKHTQDQVAALSKEIEDLITEYHKVQALIRGNSPHYASLTQPQPIDVLGIQQNVLDPDTLLLEFSLGEERSYLWVVSKTALNAFELPNRTEIEDATRRVRELILASQPRAGVGSADSQAKIKDTEIQLSKASAALSSMLFGKAAHLFEKKRLVIVAEGALQYLPFSALPEPSEIKADNAAGNQAAPLIANHEIVYEPSASVLFAQRNETRDRPLPPKMIAVFADPVFEKDDPRLEKKQVAAARTGIGNRRPRTAAPVQHGRPVSSVSVSQNSPMHEDGLTMPGRIREGPSLSRLPSTRNEAEAILALVPAEMRLKAVDFDASLTTVNSANLSQYRVLHFATHGLLDSEHPELSALVLSLVDKQGRDQNGFLRLSDIYNLDLSAQLVVLSACNTGLGKEVRGEGLVGIVRGFMYAGAPRVIASLWKVEDEATAELMKHFYQHLFEKGEPAAAALRAAQKEISQMKRWKAPYYWAPFVLQGEWK